MQRIGAIRRVPAVLAEFGLSLAPVTADLGLDPAGLDDPDASLPFHLIDLILTRCAEATGCAHFGLLVGMRTTVADLGLPGAFIANAPTLGVALNSFADAQAVNSRAAALYLYRLGDQLFLGYAIYAASHNPHAQAYQLSMAFYARVIAALAGGAVRPVEVLLPFPKPRDALPFLRAFGAPVRFDQPQAALVLPLAALNAGIPCANADVFAALRARVAAELAAQPWPWSQRVRRAMRPLILRGDPTVIGMAGVLGLHDRTLSRRLAAEGSSFQALLDHVRHTMACELLAFTALDIADVSDAIGYAHQASFTAAFRRWTGLSPSRWRTIRV